VIAFQPIPTASAAAWLIAAIAMLCRLGASSAKRRPARGEWISAMRAADAERSGVSISFDR